MSYLDYLLILNLKLLEFFYLFLMWPEVLYLAKLSSCKTMSPKVSSLKVCWLWLAITPTPMTLTRVQGEKGRSSSSLLRLFWAGQQNVWAWKMGFEITWANILLFTLINFSKVWVVFELGTSKDLFSDLMYRDLAWHGCRLSPSFLTSSANL